MQENLVCYNCYSIFTYSFKFFIFKMRSATYEFIQCCKEFCFCFQFSFIVFAVEVVPAYLSDVKWIFENIADCPCFPKSNFEKLSGELMRGLGYDRRHLAHGGTGNFEEKPFEKFLSL